MKITRLIAALSISALCLLPSLRLLQADESAGSTAPSAPVPFRSVTGPAAGEATALSGAGSTFAAPLYADWYGQYKTQVGVSVSYDPAGSGEGIRRIQEKEVDFGASDAPMDDKQLAQAKGGALLHIPTAASGITVVYNVPGLHNPLRFTGADIAGIYLGAIRAWDDPRLVADNPELATVGKGQQIIAFHRQDGSGTTFGFTSYLSSVSSQWSDEYGKGTSSFWPFGAGEGGNVGVSKAVSANPFSIGYTELNFALDHNLNYAMIKNRDGNFVTPSLSTVADALSSIAASAPNDLRLNPINAAGQDSYPITTATYMLVYRNQPDPAKATALVRLLWWSTHDAQAANEPLHYGRLPEAIVARSETLIKSITANGQPVPVP